MKKNPSYLPTFCLQNVEIHPHVWVHVGAIFRMLACDFCISLIVSLIEADTNKHCWLILSERLDVCQTLSNENWFKDDFSNHFTYLADLSKYLIHFYIHPGLYRLLTCEQTSVNKYLSRPRTNTIFLKNAIIENELGHDSLLLVSQGLTAKHLWLSHVMMISETLSWFVSKTKDSICLQVSFLGLIMCTLVNTRILWDRFKGQTNYRKVLTREVSRTVNCFFFFFVRQGRK